MPTFTAIALDRLLEAGASKSADKSVPSSNPVAKPSSPLAKAKPVPNSNLERRNSTSIIERKSSRPQISPALYATPEATPLPDSPASSFPPSPYIINHKRRGPRLSKSFSEDDVTCRGKSLDTDEVKGNGENAEIKIVDSSEGGAVTFTIPDSGQGEPENSVVRESQIKETLAHGGGSDDALVKRQHVNGLHYGEEVGSGNGKFGSSNMQIGVALEKNVQEPFVSKLESVSESGDFFDPQESMSYTSNTDCEDNTGADSSAKLAVSTPAVEFFDAWEELSSESGLATSRHDQEAELREMRLSLLMEIEKRKQAEETLNAMRNHWQRVKQQLALAGLTVPACPIPVVAEEQHTDTDSEEDLSQQVYLARFVSDAIGRGMAKAEAEMEMEAQLAGKNFEIARLWDRLHYYEALNQEMSQRNQEAVEMARRNRQVRKRRQRWVWGSIAVAVSLGTAALAWSYIATSKGSSTASNSLASERDGATKG